MTKYHLSAPSKKSHRWLFISLILLIAGASLALLIVRIAPDSSKSETNSATPNSIFTSVAGRYLFNGTVTWARAVERDAKRRGNYDYAYPFSKLGTFDRAAYDAWATDFECPITTNTVPYQTQVNQLVFNCRPEFLPEASKYFNLFDLANNHTGDQGGAVGLAETRKHLAQTPGVQYFGNFDPSITTDTCEVIAIPVRLQKPGGTEDKSALPVAMCAWHYFYRKPGAGEIEIMKQYADVMPVFAFAEMGPEYQAKAGVTEEDIAHTIIDQGAEFLIANNPHWVQNTEVYKNKLVVYSTGNFIFDQLDAETNRSASIDVTITVPYNDNIAKWLALAPSCLSFQDTCLAQAKQQDLSKPNLALKYGVVAGQNGAGQLTRKADSATQAAVEQRLNWATSMQQLNN